VVAAVAALAAACPRRRGPDERQQGCDLIGTPDLIVSDRSPSQWVVRERRSAPTRAAAIEGGVNRRIRRLIRFTS